MVQIFGAGLALAALLATLLAYNHTSAARIENGQRTFGKGRLGRMFFRPQPTEQLATPRPATFLHVTDLHIDPYYQAGTKPKSACHRQSHKHKHADVFVGPYGSPLSFCDSPEALLNLTFDHLAAEHSKSVDFIVYTGDSARHDSDPKQPRPWSEVLELQRRAVAYIEQIARPRGLPVIPTIGNNDIPDHNALQYTGRGVPNAVLDAFAEVWARWIPADQTATFRELGSYYRMVRDDLAVVAFNTLYLFNMNTAVDDCDSLHSAGARLLRWLERHVLRPATSPAGACRYKVLLSGHVPPNVFNVYPQCYLQFSALLQRYRGVLLGGVYGHMNLDHFLFTTTAEAEQSADERSSGLVAGRSSWYPFDVDGRPLVGASSRAAAHGDSPGPLAGASYLEYLLGHYGRSYRRVFPGLNSSVHRDEAYGLSLVSGSIVPLYNPAYRVFTVAGSAATLHLAGYEQYAMNLTEWNRQWAQAPSAAAAAALPPPQYKFAYSASLMYDISSIAAVNFCEAAGKVQGSYCDDLNGASHADGKSECIAAFDNWRLWYTIATGAVF